MTYSSTTNELSANATTIWVNLNTFNIPNPQDYNYDNVPSYSNSLVSLSSYFYVQTLSADHVGFTINGKLPFYKTYWPRVESRFVATINSAIKTGTGEFLSNKPLLNYPTSAVNLSASVTLLSGASLTSPVASFLAAPVSGVTFNLSTAPVTGNYLTYNIQRTDSLGRDTGGYYIGTFTPYITGVVILLSRSLSSVNIIQDIPPQLYSGFNPISILNDRSRSPLYTTAVLSGTSDLINVANFDNTYFARKFGQGFDYGTLLKQYALQPTINQNTVFFDTFLPAVAGVSATTEDTFGGVTYEKIANFVPNTSDPSTANVSQFYSLVKSLGIELDNFDYDIPPTLSRIVDLYSTQQSTVWGARSLFARNFANKTDHVNLGPQLTAYNVYTAVVTKGQKIVVNDIFDTQYYELLEVPAITSYTSITARGLQDAFPPQGSLSFPLITYPLSAFFGWGLTTPVANNYRFYVYNDTIDGTQVEGLVNWDDPYTTLSESISGHSDWVKDEGTLETIFNYYIHKGLGLIK